MATESKNPYPVTVATVRRSMLGIQPTLDAIDSAKPGELDQLILQSIYSAIAELEREASIDLSVKRILTFPGPDDIQSPADNSTYDLQEEQFDYMAGGVGKLGFWTLRHRPIISIQRMAVEFNEQEQLVEYPLDWLRIENKVGRVTIVPSLGTASYSGAIGDLSFLPQILSGYGECIPTMVSIDYTAGIADLDTGMRWADLRLWLAKKASLFVRESIMELIPSGGGADGVSVSYATPEDVAERIEKGWENFKRVFRKTQSPIRMRII